MERKPVANRLFFGLGTVGRDMLYSLVSMYLLVFLTEVLDLSDAMLAVVGGILTALRIFDAFNDPITGVIVDNTRTKWGKFKPWIMLGGIAGAVLTVLMFTDLGLTGVGFYVVFTLIYLAWDVIYGLNDIAYWGMLPTLSAHQKEREKIGSTARICANIGMYIVVVGILPITGALTEALGDAKRAWFLFAVAVGVLMLSFLCFTLFGAKEKVRATSQETTSLRQMFSILFKNDQLMWVALSMALFMFGYCTTTSFGVYFFKYAFGDEGMYSVFAAVLGVAQLSALAVFPALSKKFSRRAIFVVSMILVGVGYLLFFLSPMNMLPIGIAGLLLFIGQAFIQLMMYMFVADCVEYGQWKIGSRNESIISSVMPFINKIGGAVATGIVTATLIVSGINSANTAADVTSEGLLIMKLAMMILPLIFIAASFLVYMLKYKLDRDRFDRIVAELKERGQIEEQKD